MPVYHETNKKKQTKDGRSYYYKCYYTDKFGNRKQKVSKMFKLRKEAEQDERNFLQANITRNANNIEYTKNPSFEQVYNEWKFYKLKSLKCTTSYGLEKNLDKHIYNFFKEYKNIHSITLNVISMWLKYLESTKKKKKYLNVMIGYFKEFLSYASDNYDYDKKINSKIIKFRDDEVDDKIREAEWNFWTYDEFCTFIKTVDDKLYYTIFNFLYFTGLRLGEMIALTWDKLDFNKKTIYIDSNFTNKLGDGKQHIVKPKTKKSIDFVDLDDNTIELLKEHRKKEEKIYNFNEKMFIFGNVTPIAPTTFSRKLEKYIKKSNVKRITPHGFRHSCASLLINLGCDSRDVAKRLRDTVETVENTYYHMFPDKKSITVNAINNLIKNKNMKK